MRPTPSYDGSGLVNLVADIERRLRGDSVSPGLSQSPLPEADTYVLVLFDGLGVAQLEHSEAGPLKGALSGQLQAPFPSTTPVSLATVATALPPSLHGQVAHLSWYPDLDLVVNTLKWLTLGGKPVAYDYDGLLPSPNLWERLSSSGVEPVTVQPADFENSPLSRVLYRGARFEGAWDAEDLVTATLSLAEEPHRLIFTYVPMVDVAGHVYGLESQEFTEAMRAASGIWETLSSRLPDEVALIGTADHGLLEVAEADKIIVRDPKFDALRMAGDIRGVHLWGDPTLIEDLRALTGGELVDPAPLIGPDPTEKALSHLGEQLLLAPAGKAIVPRGFDRRLRCYHGGLTPAEVEIPLLLG